jgi:hypothetical protein
VREVAEEAGVIAEVEGVLALRNRYDPDIGNSLYGFCMIVIHALVGLR